MKGCESVQEIFTKMAKMEIGKNSESKIILNRPLKVRNKNIFRENDLLDVKRDFIKLSKDLY